MSRVGLALDATVDSAVAHPSYQRDLGLPDIFSHQYANNFDKPSFGCTSNPFILPISSRTPRLSLDHMVDWALLN